MPKILIVLTSHERVEATGKATGFYYDELATAYWSFIDAGFDVNVASIKGGAAPHDPSSLDADVGKRPASVQRFVTDNAAMASVKATLPIADLSADDYNGIFLPGGHGTMWDLPTSEPLARIIGTMFDAGKAIGAVCHGPAGLVSATRTDGRSIVAGLRVNAFTDAEEEAAGYTDVVPFLLQTRLTELGGRFEGGPNFAAYAVRDGNLITGQNPASTAATAEHMVAAVREHAAIAAQFLTRGTRK